jgi:hypothetical protein
MAQEYQTESEDMFPTHTLGPLPAFHQGSADVAADLTQLRDLKPRPFVLGPWRLNMEKNTGDKQAKDEEIISDQEIWQTIRYLDPDAKDEASGREVIIPLLAVFAIVCAVVAVLYSRGL